MPTKMYTVPQLARYAKRSESAINRLLKTGKLKGDQTGPKRSWLVPCGSKEEVVATIHALMPRGGYSRGNGGRPSKAAKKRTSDTIHLLKTWLDIDETKRAKLLKVAERFSTDELDIILEL
jgi:hypothetical protein